MTRAITLAAALLIAASSAHAQSSVVPVPELKPATVIYQPWFAHLDVPRDCKRTSTYLKTARDNRVVLLDWVKLPYTWNFGNRIGAVGQLWGIPHGDTAATGADWVIVAALDNGLTCEIAKGIGLPKWAAHIGGRPA